ncbi:MAG TPA: protein translocase subunit SecD, partial [Bacteroidetes bacterium]|nr:protein translocase subunit SecD [Bacteroidota bacterium]
MQGKGLIQFFLVTLIIVCIYQLSFTWVASNIEKDAVAYAESNVPADLSSEQKAVQLAELKTDYLIRKANEDVYNLGIAKYNYDEVKERAINLGLDLQGGMSVVLEVSKYDLITSLSNNPKNPKLLTSLDKARAAEGRGEGELIDLFVSQYEKDNPGSQLVTLFTSRDNTESLPATSSNGEVRSFLKDQADRGINSTYTKLKERIDKFGVSQPYITLQQNTGRIIVELPGVDNPKQVRKLLQSTANLQFWETYTIQQLSSNLTGANEALRLLLAAGNLDEAGITEAPAEAGFFSADSTTVAATDSAAADNPLLAATDSADNEPVIDTTVTTQGPLSKILLPPGGAGPVIGYVNVKDTALFMKYMSYEEVQAELPGDARVMLASSPLPSDKDLYEVYAMKARLDGTGALLEGDVISSASQSFNPTNGSPEVTMTMKSDGAKAWRRITSENKGAFIAITLDNQVYSAPRINEEIPNGRSVISGSFDIKEAQILSNILEVGKLPVPSRIVQEDIVGPSLGKESIRVGLLSLIAGLILVVLFMIFYYSRAGIISDIALLANIFFIFGVLASLGATLTLPGIAGLVLTMGMAVDANVIIFERI